MPTVLITNDDGVDAPGLLALKHALTSIARIIVIAPDRNWSAAGHTKTLSRPLSVRSVQLADGSSAFCTDGAPSDCVALATLGFVKQKIDAVIAGINHGPNLGDDITYSGTVAAAMEGSLAHIPSVAVSLDVYGSAEAHYETAAGFAVDLIRRVLSDHLEPDVLLNVNVPNLAMAEITGVSITRLGKRIYRDVLEERPDRDHGSVYWIGGDCPTGLKEDGTDIQAVAEGRISVTPIHLDLTCHRIIRRLEGWELRIPSD
ncbi:MAG: 5'/3'-nucleotidase SurE [Chloroflexota bacterium]|nr:5'/3'-nucleotidase SurE [Chloroflexota bacterium]